LLLLFRFFQTVVFVFQLSVRCSVVFRLFGFFQRAIPRYCTEEDRSRPVESGLNVISLLIENLVGFCLFNLLYLFSALFPVVVGGDWRPSVGLSCRLMKAYHKQLPYPGLLSFFLLFLPVFLFPPFFSGASFSSLNSSFFQTIYRPMLLPSPLS
jgi:hypothetical protein